MLLCALIPIGGVTLYNATAGGDLVLIASQGGVNFYIGNNERSDGRTAIVPVETGLADGRVRVVAETLLQVGFDRTHGPSEPPAPFLDDPPASPPVRPVGQERLVSGLLHRKGGEDHRRPAVETVDQIDLYHGTPVADPYRWLEEDVRESPRVARWVAAQNEVTFGYLAGRIVVARQVGSLGMGSHVLNLSAGRVLPAGVYLLRLTQGDMTASARVVMVK